MSAPQELSPATWQGVDDIVIVGAGLAGLFCALKLAPRPVTVLAAAPIGEGASSAWAQGGIAAALAEGDTPEAHLADTMRAGAGIVDEAMARLMVEEAPARIDDLLSYGVPFDRDLEGHLMQSREAAHTARRVVRVKGDAAGKAIMEALVATVRATPSIRLVEGYVARDILMWKRFVTGVAAGKVTKVEGPDALALKARAVVLATGGIGRLYAVTTNPTQSRGEGMVLAARAGAEIADAEFVQFHPTAIAVDRDPAPLATEALRGDGALLVNADGRRFMTDIHPDAELAPRDIVARAVHTEAREGRGAFLDCRPLGAKTLASFPKLMEICREAGIDPTTTPIPIEPAAHYHMGGVLTDARGRTTVDGLWAIGEVASTGVHGANRLASNSLLEAVVFAAHAAEDILGLDATESHHAEPDPELGAARSVPPKEPVAALRRLMANEVGVVRTEAGLKHALTKMAAIEARHGENGAFADLLAASRMIAVAALERTESRGGHFRSDHPEADPDQATRKSRTLTEVNRIAREITGDVAQVA